MLLLEEMWAGGYPALGTASGESGTLQLLGSGVYTEQPHSAKLSLTMVGL